MTDEDQGSVEGTGLTKSSSLGVRREDWANGMINLGSKETGKHVFTGRALIH